MTAIEARMLFMNNYLLRPVSIRHSILSDRKPQ
jgi:hypothetical protein